MAGKRPPAREHLRRTRLRKLEVERAEALRQRLAGVAGEHRLGIEGVELARAPMHEQRNHRPGPRAVMGPAWSQRRGRHAVATKNAERRKCAEAEAGPGEEIAARER